MSELDTEIISELNKLRTSLILAVERQRAELDPNGFIATALPKIARLEARITELGGAFDPYEYR